MILLQSPVAMTSDKRPHEAKPDTGTFKKGHSVFEGIVFRACTARVLTWEGNTANRTQITILLSKDSDSSQW